MSLKSKMSKLFLLAMNPQVLFYNGNYVFIISHMRSRSSLLSHILGSNEEIVGYREFHQSYNNMQDLKRLRMKILFDTKETFSARYVLDKILNNNCELSDEILHMNNIKFIFLLREPTETLKSTIDLGDLTGIDWYKDVEQVKDYYIKRLDVMKKYVDIVYNRSFFIDSNDIVENTEEVLNDVSEWLMLDKKLDQNYSTFESTGKKNGAGDPSENISAGTIIKTESKQVDIPEEIIKITYKHYEECKQYILSKLDKTKIGDYNAKK